MKLEIVFTDADESSIKSVEINEFDFGQKLDAMVNLVLVHFTFKVCVAIKMLNLEHADEVMSGPSVAYMRRVNILSINFLDNSGEVVL